MGYLFNGNGNTPTIQSFITPTETTDVCDANSPLLATGDIRVLNQIFQPYGRRRAFNGHVVTVKSFEDNAVVVETILDKKLQHKHPKVLIIDAGGSLRRSMVGSVLAQMAYNMGWAGIVVNGCIRDVDEMNSIDIGVRALGAVPVRSFKKGGGEKYVTVHFAGALIKDGDWLCADSSGILVSNCELSILGPLYRPIQNETTINGGGFYHYTHIMADYTSPVEMHRLFKAHFIDDHNFLPKFLPESFKSVEFVLGESTGVGCIKLMNFPQDHRFKYMKNRVDELDHENLYIKYSIIEGDILEDKWDHIVYEIKLEPYNTGTHFKMIGHYQAKKDVIPTEEDVKHGREELKHMHKVVQEVLLLYPHLYA
ncbi:uncharacterized protein LOC104906773 [Beta vulgaris subsp. vulgaris]|uniref:uncharacterized protein LOC104906773 n=1 Tax=Beta vulgaris subsp. vulgaris TaxID=3555 RepID=UPI00203715E0|nr:uncharacterized protein LOC104906773 [Beta vulgaris subsp. vulgaris]